MSVYAGCVFSGGSEGSRDGFMLGTRGTPQSILRTTIFAMDPNPWPRRYKVIVLVSLAVTVLVLGTKVVQFSQKIGTDMFSQHIIEVSYDIDVLGVGGGRITLPRTAATERVGLWSIESESAQGQVAEIISITDSEVERVFMATEGEFSAGDKVRLLGDVYFGDPKEALNITFETVRAISPLGINPAWYVDGDGETWVIYVHGRTGSGRGEALRFLPALKEERLPVLVISYRSDGLAPEAPAASVGWGYDEWLDIKAAVRFAESEGAKRVVLFGSDLGANAIMTYLHEAGDLTPVAGVVLEGPVLDVQATVDRAAAEFGIPGILRPFTSGLVRVRYGIDWPDVDQIDRASQFDVPILLLAGTEDPLTPMSAVEQFAAAVPDDLVTLVTFEGGLPGTLWNVDPDVYEAAVLEFVTRLIAS
ncbi:hypothetical protein MNBD_ACTINO02-3094 [hydrothermal vent metagenome]|uniref:AB hydrolase-1 domain-containing protein n=1 Tax=hydrothermal vent metagenome TaxID=652676 RepID=A0A3B0SIX4_9ZZZZ